MVPPWENGKEPKDTVDATSSASVTKVDSIFTIQQGGNPGTSKNFSKTQDFEIKSKNENYSETVPNAADVKVLILQRKPPHSLGSKPVLPSISVENHNQRWAFSSDDSTGFTFPVSTSIGVSSEPSTPSILSPIAASGKRQPEDGPAVPSYRFGLTQSTPLIFAFPSSSCAPSSDDASDYMFNFGSDNTRRIPFNAIGKDAIC